jgi:hypothetical protein
VFRVTFGPNWAMASSNGLGRQEPRCPPKLELSERAEASPSLNRFRRGAGERAFPPIRTLGDFTSMAGGSFYPDVGCVFRENLYVDQIMLP